MYFVLHNGLPLIKITHNDNYIKKSQRQSLQNTR
jgi:hypothetical protein